LSLLFDLLKDFEPFVRFISRLSKDALAFILIKTPSISLIELSRVVAINEQYLDLS
jgi:hypothetical protein